MPAYDFECKKCGNQQEEFYLIADCPRSVMCDKCGHGAVKIITIKRNGVQTDEPAWITDGSVALSLQPPGEKNPIMNRTDMKRHMKEKGIMEL